MSSDENIKTANLDFFRSAILEPALSIQGKSFPRDSNDVVADFDVIEAAHWASLGAQIGYFDGEDAEELVVSSERVFDAWTNLQSRNILSLEEDWARVIRVGEGGRPTLNKDLFSIALEIKPEIRELLQQTFQIFLLLTAEDLLDENSRYFMDSIGWTDDVEWNLRRRGLKTNHQNLADQKFMLLGFANQMDAMDIGLSFVNELEGRDIGLGFANVLNYWKEMESSSASLRSRSAGMIYYRSLARMEPIRVSFSKGLAADAARSFTQDARAILSRRFNLSKVEIVERYFVLAGEFVNRGRENTAAWIDARNKIFWELAWLITYAGGSSSIEENIARLWHAFTGGHAASSVDEKTVPPDKDKEWLWRAPPLEFNPLHQRSSIKEKQMQPPKTYRPHGGVRGANLSRSSLLFAGPFGRIFRAVPPADFGPDDKTTLDNLAALAKAMIADLDPPKDGPDAEESGIPSAYTYFGQFIDHDLTFDPASSLQKQNDPDALVDYRTPQFDLDNIYGRGPDDQPYMYNADSRTFILGDPLTGAPQVNANAKDLQRNIQERAVIGDPRNDENVIVSQLQGLWHRFHNKIAADNPTWPFPRVQQEVRFHYQWVLLHDFLPTIVAKEVLEKVLPTGKDHKLIIEKANLEFFHFKEFAFMPLEFSAAAYRFGHSMVRPGYRLNDTVAPLPIFAPGTDLDLRGFKAPKPNWALDWRRFMDLAPLDYGTLVEDPDQNDPKNQNRLQLAYRIDTSLVNPLKNLPASVATNPSSLAQRNLERGWRMRLPSGQDVARAMGLIPLSDDKILIGKFTGDPADIVSTVAALGDGKSFVGNCPLWTYILAETVESTVVVKTLEGDKPIKTRKLGPVGGRIVAETFVGLLLADSSSYVSLNSLWEPTLKVKGVFGLRELIQHALDG